MGWLYQLFFPAHTPTENELEMGRYRIIAEGAVAGVIYTVATGNFLAGYLSSLGASVSLCAAAAMIPSFGCVLQFISPFVFERMNHRKLAIWLMCVVFRLSVSSILLIPLALPDPGHARAVVLVLYTIGFFSAGLVTPGLEHMVLGIAPQGGRGQFYAVKSIIGTCVSSAATLALGRVLDYYLEQGQGYTGFLIIGIVSLSLTVVDAVLLASVRENPVKFTSKMRPADILRPVRDPAYRPLLFYCIIGGLTGGFASPFLSVYELRVLGLSHTFITSVGVVSAVVGMAGSWVWGAAGRPHCVELRYLAYCIPESFLHAGLVLCAPFLCTFGCAGSDCRCGGLCRRRITGKHKPAICIES